MVIVGSIGYDDIETVVSSGSDILGGSAVHAGVSASFHMPPKPNRTLRVGLVAPVGDDERQAAVDRHSQFSSLSGGRPSVCRIASAMLWIISRSSRPSQNFSWTYRSVSVPCFAMT